MAKRNIQTLRSQDSQKAKRESGFLTPEEIAALLRVPDKRSLQGKRDYAILKVLFASGLRSAELCSLNVGDVQTYRNASVLRVVGKGKKLRMVPLHPEAESAIKNYWRADSRNGDDPGEAIFFTIARHGPWPKRRLTYKSLRCLIERTRKAALIQKKVTCHTTRHTALTWLLHNGADLKTVQIIAGPSSIQTTEKYLHADSERMIQAVNALTFGS